MIFGKAQKKVDNLLENYKKMIAVVNIQDLIPQKPPFVMIDKLLSITETSTQHRFWY